MLSWAQELGQAGTYFNGLVDGNAGVTARQCRPEYFQMDDDVYFELRQRCSGYSIDMRYAYGSEDEEWPYPYSAYKHLDPVVETVFDWDGRTYTQVSRKKLNPGQEVTEEYTIWTRAATDTIWDTVDRILEEQTPPGGSISSETYRELINRSWGIQDQERVVAAALGDVAPFSGEEIVGVIATTRHGIGRLVTLRLEPDGLYTPVATITVPCEPNFARLEVIDLDGDSQDEVLFNTIILTETEPMVHDQLSIFAWGKTGLELLFQGVGAFPNGTTRGIYAADLDGDGIYEIVQEHPFFDLDLSDPQWPTLDRIYSVYEWDAETGRYHFWQKRREPYGRPGEIEILEEAIP